ncbi:maleylpyruvate isomerase N-terminal domain-containing protein [Arthrobacter castelli]|uniref:maleylpyruvate isomerase N-terminal domain-containing protein n=1 Tax=Arthrobacter castelli TaxID=271431 RepID=UPI0003FD6D7C|nr:maleylpyruvate isomerase N-terminal domain-containing protein [Arthrobacter castelli]
MNSTQLLAEAYRPILGRAERVDEEEGWFATQLPGWTVRDLLFHLASDCQRALVAFSTPSAEEPDTDEITYWSRWKPGGEAAQSGLRGTRIIASVWSSVRGPAELYMETAQAVLHAAANSDPDAVVVTQNRRMRVDSLLRTLAVEAAVHHLDLEQVLPHPPAAPVLKEVRRVLDGLLGESAPEAWQDIRYIRIGTGRLPLNQDEHEILGPLADRLPLFG